MEDINDFWDDEDTDESLDDFDEWITAVQRVSGEKWFYARVVGVSYDNLDGSSRQAVIHHLRRKQRLRLEREEDNPVDPLAIRVVTLAMKQVGYLDAHAAAECRDAMDRGKKWAVFVAGTGLVGDIMGVRIALLRMGGDLVLDRTGKPRVSYIPTADERAANAIEKFQQALEVLQKKEGAESSFVVSPTGTYRKNKDGSRREDLIAELSQYSPLSADVDIGKGTVSVINDRGQILGHVSPGILRKLIVERTREGCRWLMVAGPVAGGRGKDRVRLAVGCMYWLPSVKNDVAGNVPVHESTPDSLLGGLAPTSHAPAAREGHASGTVFNFLRRLFGMKH